MTKKEHYENVAKIFLESTKKAVKYFNKHKVCKEDSSDIMLVVLSQHIEVVGEIKSRSFK